MMKASLFLIACVAYNSLPGTEAKKEKIEKEEKVDEAKICPFGSWVGGRCQRFRLAEMAGIGAPAYGGVPAVGAAAPAYGGAPAVGAAPAIGAAPANQPCPGNAAGTAPAGQPCPGNAAGAAPAYGGGGAGQPIAAVSPGQAPSYGMPQGGMGMPQVGAGMPPGAGSGCPMAAPQVGGYPQIAPPVTFTVTTTCTTTCYSTLYSVSTSIVLQPVPTTETVISTQVMMQPVPVPQLETLVVPTTVTKNYYETIFNTQYVPTTIMETVRAVETRKVPVYKTKHQTHTVTMTSFVAAPYPTPVQEVKAATPCPAGKKISKSCPKRGAGVECQCAPADTAAIAAPQEQMMMGDYGGQAGKIGQAEYGMA